VNILTIGQYAAAIMACGVLFGAIINWMFVKPIKAYIDLKTYPIQPTANGGRSLPDVVLGIEAIKYRLTVIENRLNKLERDTPQG